MSNLAIHRVAPQRRSPRLGQGIVLVFSARVFQPRPRSTTRGTATARWLRGGDSLPATDPGVAGPDVARPGGVKVGGGTELAALGIVGLVEPVVLDDDVGGGVSEGGAAVDGVTAASEQVVLDGLVHDRPGDVLGVDGDGIGLVE